MLELNREAAQAMATVAAHAATDVTGFGLLGHLHYLARASGLAARVDADLVPSLPGAEELADAGEVPGGTRANERFMASRVRWPAALSAARRTLLCDAQTSGGLLIAVPAEQVDPLLQALGRSGAAGWTIGELATGEPGIITVV